MSAYDSLVVLIKLELKKTDHGRRTLSSWTDGRIKTELRDPCFFGAKPEMTDKERAIRHFKRIAELHLKKA